MFMARVCQLPDHGESPRHRGAPERGDAVPHSLLLHLQLGVTCRVETFGFNVMKPCGSKNDRDIFADAQLLNSVTPYLKQPLLFNRGIAPENNKINMIKINKKHTRIPASSLK